MEAVWLKIKADISSRKLISTMIVITIAAASTLLTLALATLMNISAPYDRSFEELNAAHLWLYFDRELIRMRDIQRIESLPGVVASTGVQYSVNTRAQIGDMRVWVSLRAMPDEMPEVNRLLVQEGRYLQPRQFEVLASKDLNDLYHLDVGDKITISRADGKQIALPVIGLAYNPMWDTYRNSQPPYLYVSQDTMRKLYPDEATWDWSVGVRLAEADSVETVKGQIDLLLRSGTVIGYTDWRNVKQSSIFGSRLNFIFLGSFSFFAILASIMVITSNISSSVLSQFRQIGILKSVGFTQKQILLLYLGQYLVLGVIGSWIGLFLGIILSLVPLKNISIVLNAMLQSPVSAPVILLVLSIIPGIVLIATWGAAWRGAQTNTIKAIVTGAESPQKSNRVIGLIARLNWPVILTMGMNEVLTRPFRSLLTGLNLTLGVIAVVFGLTLNETLRMYRENPNLLGVVHDAVVTREQSSDERVRYFLRQSPDIAAFYGECLVNVETRQGQAFQVRAVEGDVQAFPFQITRGQIFQPDTYQAIAGQGLLDWLDLAVGDEITLILNDQEDRPVIWQIVGQYIEPANTGQMLMVSLSSTSRALGHIEPYNYYVKLVPAADVERLKKYLEPKPGGDLSLTLTRQAIPDAVYYLQWTILALAVILIGIALVNVFNTSMLTVQERVRKIGLLKTLGMTPRQVVAMINVTSAFLGATATVAGIPLGLALTQSLFSILSRNYGFGQVNMTLNWLYMILLVPLMILVSMLGSTFPGQRAARLSIIQVLRSE